MSSLRNVDELVLDYFRHHRLNVDAFRTEKCLSAHGAQDEKSTARHTQSSKARGQLNSVHSLVCAGDVSILVELYFQSYCV